MLLPLIMAVAASAATAGDLEVEVGEDGAMTLALPISSPEDPPGFRKLEDGHYRFGRARITVPVNAGRWELHEITNHSFDQILKYRVGKGSGVATLFLTLPFRADERLLWMNAAQSFDRNRPQPIAPSVLLETAAGRYRARQIVGRAPDGTQVAELLAHGVNGEGWIVKLRITSRGASPGEALQDARDILGSLQFPEQGQPHATDDRDVPTCANVPPLPPARAPGPLSQRQRDEAMVTALIATALMKQVLSVPPVSVSDRCLLGRFEGKLGTTMSRMADPAADPDYLGTVADSGTAIMPLKSIDSKKKLDWVVAMPGWLTFLPQTSAKVDDGIALGVAAGAEAGLESPTISVRLQ